MHSKKGQPELNANSSQSLGDMDPGLLKLNNFLEGPSFVYRGVMNSDGVTDMCIKIIPHNNDSQQNASNLYKQCLFRIEVQQNCMFNERATKLRQLKENTEQRLKKMVKEKGSEMNFEQQAQMKKEIERIVKDLEENNKRKKIQDENNRYEQKYRRGNKLTYGTPIQLKHLFSDNYLCLSTNTVSFTPGSSMLTLSESTEQCWFTLEPSEEHSTSGMVVNYHDFFKIKSINSKTPFYLHVLQKPDDEFTNSQTFSLIASSRPSILKAKLFMHYQTATTMIADDEEEAANVPSGECIRLKQLETESYLTTSSIVVDRLLPQYPDFLKS